MNNEEKDIERQEFARRVGKNGDRILMEYFDDIGLANKTNNEINDLLDGEDYIKEKYFLEVSSPGIERILRKDKHLKENIGKEITIKLFKKDERGNKEYQGILEQFDEDTIKLVNEIVIERKNIAQIKTVYNW